MLEMEYTKQQVNIVNDMCWKEIKLLKLNLEKLMEDSKWCQKRLNELLFMEGANDIFCQVVFDRYMTQMMTSLNMARKYNIYLEINDINQTLSSTSLTDSLEKLIFTQSDFFKDFKERRKDSEIKAFDGSIKTFGDICEFKKPNEVHHTNIIMKSVVQGENHEISNICSTEKISDVSSAITNMLNILLPVKCFSKFKIGFEFEACVVYVRDYKKLEFFICLKDDYKTFYDLSSNLNFKLIPHNNLPKDDMFCVLKKRDKTERESICRAIMVSKQKNDELQNILYLIDFGEIIPLTDNLVTFVAPPLYRQIPPLAIKCMLKGIENSLCECITDHDKCKQILQESDFENTNFRLLHQKNGVLEVLLLKNMTVKNSIYNRSIKQTNPFLSDYNDENRSQNSTTTAETLQLPMSTFCATAAAEETLQNISYDVGDKIQVMVTHVVSPISFYGIVQNNNCSYCRVCSWHDSEILPWQNQFLVSPKLNDIVLSKYAKDGYWYRAKVVSVDLEKDLYKIFYIDFGNTEFVPSIYLSKCSSEQLKHPPRAVLFHLSHLSIVSNETTDLRNINGIMAILILDQVLNVELVERRNNELFVRLTDSQYDGIPKMLLDMGVVEENKSKSI